MTINKIFSLQSFAVLCFFFFETFGTILPSAGFEMAANRNTTQLMCVITRGQTDPSNLCAAGLLSHMQTDLFVSFLSASGFETGHSSHGQRRRSKHNKERVTHT